MVAKCCVLNCGKSKKHNVHLFRFPTHVDRCRQWVKAVGDPDLVYVPIEKLSTLRQVCASHFTEDDILHGNQKRKIKATAVPTIFEPPVTPLSDEIMQDFPLKVERTEVPQDWRSSPVEIERNEATSASPVPEIKMEKTMPALPTEAERNETVEEKIPPEESEIKHEAEAPSIEQRCSVRVHASDAGYVHFTARLTGDWDICLRKRERPALFVADRS